MTQLTLHTVSTFTEVHPMLTHFEMIITTKALRTSDPKFFKHKGPPLNNLDTSLNSNLKRRSRRIVN
ncbi:CLUMA_CG006448, isoform A [Clunio marinus]|uniref:CLUMA_CG006448, isoform A n=1 Tax=Clunio marinus TaxID=568069 RepID=A0A1J1HZB6_9DIPT|nr:CLUMA_CG006448, isoform A [Clunio marinus]